MTDREKLSELIDNAADLYPNEIKVITDHLLANGVAFATDKGFPAATPDIKSGTWKRGSHQHGNDQDGFWTEMYLKCSECGYERRDAWIPKHKPPYCEECGAKMEENK